MLKKLLSIFLLISISGLDAFATSSVSPAPVGFADVVQPLLPAVVNVYTSKHIKKTKTFSGKKIPKGMPPGIEEFFERFEYPFGFEEMYENPKSTSLGSGFIIASDGYIVTNHHVIESADEIYIKLGSNEELSAKLIGSDARTDLALLKVETKSPLPCVKFGDSTKSRVGDWVIAIGNPFGLGGTVTTGIISSKGRDITDGFVDDFIQTDTAINSGNSGGPMFNMDGDVIGVNTSIYSPSGTNIGIGFAIPSSTASHIIEQLKTKGKVSRGMLNIKIQDVTPEIAEGLDLPTSSGVLILDVDKGGAGDKAGLKPNDLIVEFNNIPVKNSRKLQIAVSETPTNTDVKLVVLRAGKQKTLICNIKEQDLVTAQAKQEEVTVDIPEGSVEKNGIIFSDLTKDLAELYGIKNKEKAVVISGFTNNRRSFFNLVVGDVISEVNQKSVQSLDELVKIYDEAKKTKKKHVVFLVKRNNMRIVVALPIDTN